MKVLEEFGNSHHYYSNYEKSDWYCPNCGRKEVWVELEMGDYYEGPPHICVQCGSFFSLPRCGVLKEKVYKDMVRQLRLKQTFKPKTKPGG